VAQSFTRALDKVIELAPEVVLIAGDIFHQVRPTNTAILHAYLQFARLRRALPNAAIVMVAGNHDTPRSLEAGNILRLFAPLGISVVDDEAQSLEFPHLDLEVLGVAHNQRARPKILPSGKHRWNLLVLHGSVEGEMTSSAALRDGMIDEIPQDDLNASEWDYIALGHYHVYKRLGPNQYYSGALDYTSSNPWGERVEEGPIGKSKGIIERDLATGVHEFHELQPAREFIDLPAISARGLTTEEVDELIREAVDGCPGGIDDKVVRLVVRNMPRHITRQLDHKALRDYRSRALHFHLDARRPDLIRRQDGQGAPGRRPSLADFVREKLRERVVGADIDRDALVTLGLRYLSDAEERESPSAEQPASVDG
jgi:exonuclease SbcD